MPTHNIFNTVGSHGKEARQENDFYATPSWAIDALLKKTTLPHNVWEPACGTGMLSERLKEFGYNVYSTDLIDRGYGEEHNVDFTLCQSLPFKDAGDVCILTNPPYHIATEFIERSLMLLPCGSPCFMFLRTAFLEGCERFERLYRHGYLMAVYQFSKRIACAKNGDFEHYNCSALAHAWFVFARGYKNVKPIIEWI